MLIVRPHGLLPGLLAWRPTVGDLVGLCEENYVLLARLAPHLKEQRGAVVSRRRGTVDLYLGVEEQSAYTSLIRLTYLFPGGEVPGGEVPGVEVPGGEVPDGHLPDRASAPSPRPSGGARSDPDARLRVYHDARQVEVLDLRQTILPLRVEYQRPALETKWRVHLFLRKWLSFCLQQGHCFGPRSPAMPLARGGDLIDAPF